MEAARKRLRPDSKNGKKEAFPGTARTCCLLTTASVISSSKKPKEAFISIFQQGGGQTEKLSPLNVGFASM